MYGSIIGDICGSIYEWDNFKTEIPDEIQLINSKCLYTDDTILTIGIGDALLSNYNYQSALLKWAKKYPNSGYGSRFREWFKKRNPKPYNSWGNGSAMRVGPIGWCFNTLEETIDEAKKSAEVTHNHKEGIKGAEAVAAAIFMARNNKSKEEIKQYIENEFGYNLSIDLNKLRKKYKFDGSCKGTVPPAIMAFLKSNNFEESIQIAISLGGDSDTLACITGSISEAFYKDIPIKIIEFVNSKINAEMKQKINEFYQKYLQKYDLNYYITRGTIIDINI